MKKTKLAIVPDKSDMSNPSDLSDTSLVPADIIAQETTLPLDLIYPNPDQPRKLFDQKALEELAENIRQHGLIQPLVVTRRGDKFLLIAGERRWRASQIAGRTEVPVRIIEADDATVEELALIENIMRRDLNLIEEANGYQALLDRGYTVEALAAKLGFKQPWRVTERTSLLNLAGDYQDLVVKGVLSPSQAFELSRVPREKQAVVFRKIRNGELNGYDKLRAFVTAMVNIEETMALFEVPAMTEQEEAALTSYERMIERCVEVVRKAYDDNDLVVLKKVTRANIQTNLDRIDLIMKGLTKIRKALTENVMQQTALELVKAA
jgi:ParB family transcriptional regulator, chromosome partitioning protein